MLPVDQPSFLHLFEFLDSPQRDATAAAAAAADDDDDDEQLVVTDLELEFVELSEPPDGGLNSMRTFFSRSDTTLTRVSLWACNVGGEGEVKQLLSVFHTNRTVVELQISHTNNVRGVALGACLSDLLLTMKQLQTLNCGYSDVTVWTTRRPGYKIG
jgi:hypothetical protein